MSLQDDLPPSGSLSIEDLIQEGKKAILLPARLLLLATGVLTVAAILLPLPWWSALVVFVAGLIGMIRFTGKATAAWRLRAYAGVADIHQLQRSAELAGILPRQSYLRGSAWMNTEERETLKRLQERFDEDEGFVDDPNVGFVTEVFRRSMVPGEHHQPVLKISAQGIGTLDYGFFPWEQIYSETVDVVKGNKYRTRASSRLHDNTDLVFRFWIPGGIIVAFPLEELDIDVTALDIAVQIHRGRWARNGEIGFSGDLAEWRSGLSQISRPLDGDNPRRLPDEREP